MDYTTLKYKITSNILFKIFSIMIILILSIIILAGFSVLGDWIERGMTGTEIVAMIVVFTFLGVPLYKIVQSMYLTRRGEKIIQSLKVIEEDAISWEKFNTITGMKNSVKCLSVLLRKKYLKVIVIDQINKKIILNINYKEEKIDEEIKKVAEEKVNKIRYEVRKCPNCGAEVVAEDGSLGYCKYCGSGVEDND